MSKKKAKKRRLQPEGGITVVSLDNGRLLLKRHGPPVRVELRYSHSSPDWYTVTAMYANGSEHTYTGFAWGYGGAGPRGLALWCKANEIPLDLKQISELNNSEDGLVWVWPKGNTKK